MKISLNWIREYIDANKSATEICNKLNQIGFESEILLNEDDKLFETLYVVKIDSITKHENADKLNICKISGYNFPKGQENQIVCGAQNIHEGMITIFAPIGTKLSEDFTIREAKIRSVKSYGMLCSYEEIGLSGFCENYDGIADLNKDFGEKEFGNELKDLVKRHISSVLDIEITPNRGDAASALGIARELHAAQMGQAKNIDFNCNIKPEKKTTLVQEDSCIYSTCLIENITNSESPLWLKNRLESVGIKPISAAVDITNYISHDIGRPLHAFDYEKINGKMKVHRLGRKTKFLALNDLQYDLSPGDLVVSDEKSVISLAGIIGGKFTSAQLNTKNILIESAYFDPSDMTNSQHNINTSAKYRFERNVDKDLIIYGLNKACRMIQDICGGEIKFYTLDKKIIIENRKVELHIKKLCQMSGIEFDKKYVSEILTRLFIDNIVEGDKIVCTVPSFRNDLLIEEDLIEEVLRIHGYDNIPEAILPAADKSTELLGKSIERKICSAMTQYSYNEIFSWSFDSYRENDLQKIDDNDFLFNGSDAKDDNSINIKNPISDTMSYMRQSILFNLLETIKYHEKHKINYSGFFEYGPVFIKSSNLFDDSVSPYSSIVQANVLSAIASSKIDIRSHFYNICYLLGVDIDEILFVGGLENISGAHASELFHTVHDSIEMKIVYKDVFIGSIGRISNDILRDHELKSDSRNGINVDLKFLEIFIDTITLLNKGNTSDYILSNQQPIQRDFSFIGNKRLEVNNLIKDIRAKFKSIVEEIFVFDFFEKYSQNEFAVAIRVNLRKKDSTFEGDEIDEIWENIVKMAHESGFRLRNPL